jgi:uncharacterized membrane protein YfcA
VAIATCTAAPVLIGILARSGPATVAIAIGQAASPLLLIGTMRNPASDLNFAGLLWLGPLPVAAANHCWSRSGRTTVEDHHSNRPAHVALCQHRGVGVGVGVGVGMALVGVFLLAAAVQGVSGFGFALLSMPLLSFIVGPKDAVAVSTLVGTVASGSLLARHRHTVRWDLVRPLLLAAAAGMPFGLYLLVVIAEGPLRLLLAVVVAAFAGLLASGWRLGGSSRALELLAGFTSGLLNTSLSTNGPPLVVALQARDLEPDEFRGTISVLFFASSLMANALLARAGRYDREILIQAAIGVPALLVGSAVGARMARRLPAAAFRRVVLALLVATALASAMAAVAG